MTAESAQERPNRRATDRLPSDRPQARQRRLVRFIAADPVLVAWLSTSKARTMMAAAARLAEAGHRDAAEMLRQYADDLATGTVSPF